VKALEPEHRHARLQLLRELFGLEDAPAETLADDAEVRRLHG
jgi:glutamyl-tRNA reductase